MQLQHLFYMEITKKKPFLQLLKCISKTLIKSTEQVFNSRFLQLLAEYKKKLYEIYIKQCIGTDFDGGFVFKPMHFGTFVPSIL